MQLQIVEIENSSREKDRIIKIIERLNRGH